jgi:hypothetical protein
MAIVAERLSASWVYAALGLLIGLPSLWCYRYLTGRLEACDHEMENASVDLVRQLARFRGRWKSGPPIESTSGRPMFGERSVAQLSQDQRSWHRTMLLTGTALLVAWCVQVVRNLEFDWLSLGAATLWASVYVLFMFGVSCLPAHALWVGFLHRRRGGTAVLASAFCLCWCVAELVFGVHVL